VVESSSDRKARYGSFGIGKVSVCTGAFDADGLLATYKHPNRTIVSTAKQHHIKRDCPMLFDSKVKILVPGVGLEPTLPLPEKGF
jgi:hypothetical protein